MRAPQPGVTYQRARRTVAVGRVAVRTYAGYKRAQRRINRLPPERHEAEWERTHSKAAQEITVTARRLRGLFIKAAQFLGARADLLPEAYIAALSTLHDRVPPQPYRAMRPVLREELGDEPERVFRRFERAPVAAASLAQVHRAELRDGRRVAVKVQYPDIGALVRLDLSNLRTVLRLVHRLESSIDLAPIAEAVGALVPQELDFINEARSAEAIGGALAHRGDVMTPAVVWEHTSRRVLVTEYIDGIKISEAAALRAAGHSTRALAERVIDVWGEQVLRLGHFHGDPHPGNILVLLDGRLALLDFGLTARLSPAGQAGVAALTCAAAARDPLAMAAAFEQLGYHARGQGPMAYMGLAGRLMESSATTAADADADIEQANVRLAHMLRGFNIEGVEPPALLVMRVLGLLKGLGTRLDRPGPALSAWLPYTAAAAGTSAIAEG